MHVVRIQRLGARLVLLASLPHLALAGMPSPPVLTDVARLRVQSISFFLVVFLASAALIQLLWNRLRTSFQRLPRLSFARALLLVAIWGLLFVIVLTMISGARELLTPGAWEHDGAIYRLRGDKR